MKGGAVDLDHEKSFQKEVNPAHPGKMHLWFHLPARVLEHQPGNHLDGRIGARGNTGKGRARFPVTPSRQAVEQKLVPAGSPPESTFDDHHGFPEGQTLE